MTRKAKIVFVNNKRGDYLDGNSIVLVDAETGEEFNCVGDITVNCPTKGIVTVNAEIIVVGIEPAKESHE